MDICYKVQAHEILRVVTEAVAEFRGFTTPEQYGTITVNPVFSDDSQKVYGPQAYEATFADNLPSLRYTNRQVADLVICYIIKTKTDLSNLHLGYNFVVGTKKAIVAPTEYEILRLELEVTGLPF